ncbi:uroporphyrinogen-III synthase [uncultured Roseobacter sp.]|uniref:uroporphyrinogen-III synthase n=1 Tax=uncultured Roseobacter sp. TaxID=114847 RepID=UPI00260CC2C1|nr:uroporphyrinogen-III synthase [uncultured Roseobacter sp.]
MGAARIPVIMTRPSGSNERFVGQMPDALRRRLQVIHSPLIEITRCDANLALGDGDAVIFTSSNGVRFAPEGQGRRAYCLGEATTRAAADAGWQSLFMGETARNLIKALLAQPPDVTIWHLSGVHVRGNISEELCRAGIDAHRVALYDQRKIALSDAALAQLTTPEPVIVPIFSPRTAAQFAENCPGTATPCLIALSAAVAEPLAILPAARLEIAPAPTAQAMIQALEKLVSRISLG